MKKMKYLNFDAEWSCYSNFCKEPTNQTSQKLFIGSRKHNVKGPHVDE